MSVSKWWAALITHEHKFLWLGLVVVLYAVAGQAHPPWTPEDMVLADIVRQLTYHERSWSLLYFIDGQWIFGLYPWLASLFAQIGLWLGLDPINAGRLVNAVLLSATIYTLWHALPSSIRTHSAWFILASQGLLLTSHEYTPQLLLLLAMALFFLGLAQSIAGAKTRLAIFSLWAAMWLSALTVGPLAAIAALIFTLCGGVFSYQPLRSVRPVCGAFMAYVACAAVLFGLSTPTQQTLLIQLHLDTIIDYRPTVFSHLYEEWLWSLWPTLPLALIALWFNRKHLRQWWMSQSLMFMLGGALLILWWAPDSHADRVMVLIIPAAVLAAFALNVLPRALASIFAWFALVLYTLLYIYNWLFWLGVHTGYPAVVVKHVSKLMANINPQFSLITALIIAILGIAWLIYASQSTRDKNALGRHWALAITVFWLTTFNLNGSWLIQRYSYEDLLGTIATTLKANDVVCANLLSPDLLAAWRYYLSTAIKHKITTDCNVIVSLGSDYYYPYSHLGYVLQTQLSHVHLKPAVISILRHPDLP